MRPVADYAGARDAAADGGTRTRAEATEVGGRAYAWMFARVSGRRVSALVAGVGICD